MEDCLRLSRPCRWINHPFTCLRVLAEGAVAVAEAALEAEDICVPRSALVDGEVGSGGYVTIVISDSFVGRGAMRSYAFAYFPKPRGRHILSLVEAHSIGGGGVGEKLSWRKF